MTQRIWIVFITSLSLIFCGNPGPIPASEKSPSLALMARGMERADESTESPESPESSQSRASHDEFHDASHDAYDDERNGNSQQACGQQASGQLNAASCQERGGDDEAPAKKPEPKAKTKANTKPQPNEAAGKKRGLPRRQPAPDFPKDSVWLNTGGPLRKQDLKGKFVLLDFWTYCCINCMHILPELKKLEQAYPNELVVIGVHSAKFEGEKETKNIEDAILRYEIEHPVINDADHGVWNAFGVNSWPSIVLLDPEGFELGRHSGEFKFESMDAVIKELVPIYREEKLLDETPIRFDLLAERQVKSALRYPGKIITDDAGKRVFIADSNHNRIIVAGYDGTLKLVIGSGEIGQADGPLDKASFNHPQGMTLVEDVLYVADTENHLIRKVDLASKTVSTIAGTGEQAKHPWPGLDDYADRFSETGKWPERWAGTPMKTALNSPWDLWFHDGVIWIAMAGPHQIWRMPLDQSEIGPYAGNGREDIVDGKLIPRQPYEMGYSSFAQPSGLSSDGKWLYVADSEGSSIRAVPFDSKQQVRTVVGTAHLPGGRLFQFGDKDGPADEALLQHALGVAYHDGQIFVADTYNNKIRVVDAESGETKTVAGSGKPGRSDEEGTFDEPAGIAFGNGQLWVADTNNHLIRTVDPKSGKVKTFSIEGLAAPASSTAAKKPSFAGAKQVDNKPVRLRKRDGRVSLLVELSLPLGWKLNPDAPMSYYLEATGEQGPIDRAALGWKSLEKPAASFRVDLPVAGNGEDTIKVSMNYYYCEESGEGLCKVGSVVFTQPIVVGDDGAETAKLQYALELK